MTIHDLYFKRARKANGEVPDVYQYTSLPQPLRIQLVYIWKETIGAYRGESALEGPYGFLVRTLRKELGVFRLPGAMPRDGYGEEWVNNFLSAVDIHIVLTQVEMAANFIVRHTSKYDYTHSYTVKEDAEAAMLEMNQRFQEHGVGFQYSDGEIIRVDSHLLHAEVVKPALQLLGGKEYAGAQAEFLKAHEDYRLGNTKGAPTESLKALESVMKVICAKRGWPHDAGATSKPLIALLFEKELIPAYWQSQFAGLRTMLESGVPTARNKDGGHGQGGEIKIVPMHLAGYVLHQTAAAIVFLAEAAEDTS